MKSVIDILPVVFFLLLLCLNAVAQPTSPARSDSIDEFGEAIAAQDRVIAAARTRFNEANAAAVAASSSFAQRDAQMRSAVAEEIRRTPRLRGLERVLYEQGMPAEVAGALQNRGQRIAEMRATLERIRREDENRKSAGLPPENRIRPLLEYSIPLFESNVAWLTTLSGSLARTGPARDARHASLRNLRQEVSAYKRAEDALRTGQLERYRLFHSLGRQFEPRYLRSVRATQGASNRVVYFATVTEPAEVEKIDDTIGFMLSELSEAEGSLQEYRRQFLDAENRFIATSTKWQQTHARYSRSISDAYMLRIRLELLDSAISVRSGEPASVLFELGWRAAEFATTDSYRIEEPKVDATLAAYRDDLARRLDEAARADGPTELLTDDQWLAGNEAALALSPRVFLPSGESVKKHIMGEQAMEFFKGATEIAIVDGTITQIALLGTLTDKRAAFNRFLYGFLQPDNGPEPETFRLLRGGDTTGPLVAKLKDSWYKEKGKDFLIGAAVTAGKEALTAQQRQELFIAAQEVALMDIEYLLRRHEYVSRGAIYRAFGKKLIEFEAGVGSHIERRSKIAGSRTLTVQTSETIKSDEPLRLQLQFSGPFDQAEVLVGGQKLNAGPDARGQAVIQIPANILTAVGSTPLSITAVVGGQGYFDSNPTTIAHRESGSNSSPPTSRFRDLESGPDQNHRLNVAGVAEATSGSGIRVVSGIYGANCNAGGSNVTSFIKRECDGKGECKYVIDHTIIGDPAQYCSKDYVATWTCDGDPEIRTARVNAEAGFGSTIVLNCTRPEPKSNTQPPACSIEGKWSQRSSVWTIAGDGTARETGLRNARGRAAIAGRTLTLDWVAADGFEGRYEIQLDNSCDRGTGTMRHTKTPAGAAPSNLSGIIFTRNALTGLTGKWQFTHVVPKSHRLAGTYLGKIDLVERNGVITGTGYAGPGTPTSVKGTIRNGQIELHRLDPNGFRGAFRGKLLADGSIVGTGANDPQSPYGNDAPFTWTATRIP